MERLTPSEVGDYLLDLGGTLLSYGCPTHRLEALIRALASTEGYAAEAFALPTGLFVTVIGDDGAQLVRMIRVEEWGVHLERLTLIDRIFNDVAEDRCSIREARTRLDELEASPPPYPAALGMVAPAGATAAAAVFFRGTWTEIGLAAVGGIFLGLLGPAVARWPRLRFLTDFLGGAAAAVLAWFWTNFEPNLSREVLVLSTVILLVPGMSLTSGLAELAHKNLVSGGARVMEAMIIFLSILVGVSLMVGIEQALVSTPHVAAAPRDPLDIRLQLVAVIIASLSFGVLFRVPRRFLASTILSGAVGWAATGVGTRALPGHLAAFLGAMMVCLVGNALARLTERPAQLFQLPGLVLLVPGSFGFLSLEAFLRGEFLGGAAKGFEMFLIAGALVTGLLVANVILPARKIL